MHATIEKARKAAGISGMTKNYPDSPKQRGCGFWAGFIGSLGTQLGQFDEEIKALLKENTRLAVELQELRDEKLEECKRAGRNGVAVLQQREGWSLEKGQQVEKMIVG